MIVGGPQGIQVIIFGIVEYIVYIKSYITDLYQLVLCINVSIANENKFLNSWYKWYKIDIKIIYMYIACIHKYIYMITHER